MFKNYLEQWSTWRGAALMALTLAGVNAEAVQVTFAVLDHLPELGVAVIGAVEFFRNEKKAS